MPDKIQFKIKGKEYLLMDTFFIPRDYKSNKELNILKSIGCIIRGIKDPKEPRLFNKAFCTLEVLVPVDKIDEFQKIRDK